MRNFISGIDLGYSPVVKEEAHDPTRLVRVSGYPLDTMNKPMALTCCGARRMSTRSW